MARVVYPRSRQEGTLPYELSGMGVAGLILSDLPSAFLAGVDIARALQQERWQRQMYEQQMKYTQSANLLNMMFDALARVGDVEQVKKTLTDQQKQQIQQTLGVNVDEMLSSIPTIGSLLPQADYSIVGERTKNLGYWLGNYYTTLPGSAVKEIFGSKITSPEGKTIEIDPNKLYVLPAGYQQLWTKKQQLEFNKAKLGQQLALHRDKLMGDEKLKAVKTALDYADSMLKTGEIETARQYLKSIYATINEVYTEKVGMPLIVDTSIFEIEESSILEDIANTIRSALGFKKEEPKTKGREKTQFFGEQPPSPAPPGKRWVKKEIAPGITSWTLEDEKK